MSYILEALKKSDRDRKREAIPDLSSDHSFSTSRREERKSPLWKSPVVLLGLLACVALPGWLLFSEGQQEEGVQQKEIAEPTAAVIVEKTDLPAVASLPVPEKNDVTTPELLAPEVITPALKEQINREVEEAVSRIVAPPEPEKAEKPVEVIVLPLLEELSADLQAAIPDLSFAGHVYAAEGRQRLIMINMRVVREGNTISPGLILEKIEENGVVLRYQEVSFRVHLF